MNTNTFAAKAGSLLAAVAFLTTQLLSATTHYVGVDDSGFSPSVLNIEVGDIVVWVNDDEFFSHTTTSDLSGIDPDYWHGVLVDYEDTYQKTFDNAGTFTYYDQGDTGTGTINVTAVTTPVITLEAPRLEADQFLFEASGLTIGRTNVLEFSTNLVQWTPVSTNIADSATMTFTNAVTSGPHLFRVVEQP